MEVVWWMEPVWTHYSRIRARPGEAYTEPGLAGRGETDPNPNSGKAIRTRGLDGGY